MPAGCVEPKRPVCVVAELGVSIAVPGLVFPEVTLSSQAAYCSRDSCQLAAYRLLLRLSPNIRTWQGRTYSSTAAAG